MWSDPEDVKGWQVSPRGAGWLFGSQQSDQFMKINKLDLIVRGHQLVQEGYKYLFGEKKLVTVFSAPNYCYRCGNLGAVLCIDRDLKRKFKVFEAVPQKERVTPLNSATKYFL